MLQAGEQTLNFPCIRWSSSRRCHGSFWLFSHLCNLCPLWSHWRLFSFLSTHRADWLRDKTLWTAAR